MYKVMALDVGTKRIGIALSDFLLMLANGHSYIPREPEDKAIETIYKIASHTLPVEIKSPVSKANVEKVVNPPQTPILSIKISFSEIYGFFAERLTISPIKNAPTILITSVFIGKTLPLFIGINPIKYLKMLPSAPPSEWCPTTSVRKRCGSTSSPRARPRATAMCTPAWAAAAS